MILSTSYLLASDSGFLFRNLCFLWPFLLLGLLFGIAAAYFHWYRSARSLRFDAENENARLREGLLIAKRAAPELQKQRVVVKKLDAAVGEGNVLKKHVQKLASKVKQRDHELVSFANRLTRQEDEVATQRSKYNESQAAARMLNDSINERNLEIAGLERKFGNERSDHKHELSKLKTLFVEQDEAHKANAQAANAQIENLQSEHDRLKLALNEKAESLESTMAQIAEVKSERDQATKASQEGVAQLEGAKVKVASLQQEYEALKNDAGTRGAAQETEISALTKRLADVQAANKSAETDLTTLKEDLVAKDNEIAELKVKERDKDDDIKLLLGELEVLESVVAKGKSSRPKEGRPSETNLALGLGLKPEASAATGTSSQATMTMGLASFAGEDVEEKGDLGVIYRSRPNNVDDLKKISGVANVLEGKLQEFGVYRYKQVALWTPEQEQEFGVRLSFKDRIERDHWRAQASQLHLDKYGEDLGVSFAGLKKSPNGLDDDAALLKTHETMGIVYSKRPSRVDDLTRIKGIGSVLEKKLHGFGVYRFKQIVEWAPKTVDVFSEQLDFKGRIEREEWIRQAAKLSGVIDG